MPGYHILIYSCHNVKTVLLDNRHAKVGYQITKKH